MSGSRECTAFPFLKGRFKSVSPDIRHEHQKGFHSLKEDSRGAPLPGPLPDDRRFHSLKEDSRVKPSSTLLNSRLVFPFLKGRFKRSAGASRRCASVGFPFLKGRFKSMPPISVLTSPEQCFHSLKEDSRAHEKLLPKRIRVVSIP